MKLILTFLCFLLTVSISSQEVNVTYIANEGVLLEKDSLKIVIDGFFSDGLRIYEEPSKAVLSQMKTATGIFSDVDYILVTHMHNDHFSKDLINEYLSKNPSCKVVSSNQIINQLDKRFKDRLYGYDSFEKGEWKVFKRKGIEIKMGRMVHPYYKNRDIVNLAYHVQLRESNYLHIGDAAMSVDNFQSLKIKEQRFDGAFIPLWFLIDSKGRQILKNHLDSKIVYAIHVSKDRNYSLRNIENTPFHLEKLSHSSKN